MKEGTPQLDGKYFPALDGLRAICIGLVILEHQGRLPYPMSYIHGWLGVDIFFLISGFLITTLLLREESVRGKVNLLSFYVRRFFRIVPLYFAVLSVYIFRASRNPTSWALMKHLLVYYLTMSVDILTAHIDVYRDYVGAKMPPFGAAWSLGVEEKFYLVWPLLFFVLVSRRWRGALIPALMGLAAFLPFRLFRSYLGLLVGCLLAVVLASEWFRCHWKDRFRVPAVAVIGIMIVAFYLVYVDVRFVFLFPFLGAILLYHLLLSGSVLVSLLSSRAFLWIGRRSYSMYLIHMAFVDAVGHFVPRGSVLLTLTSWILSVVITALAADLLFRFIEEPMRRFGKRVIAKRGWDRRPVSDMRATVMAPATTARE